MNHNLTGLCVGLVIVSGVGISRANAWFDSVYTNDREAWIGFAESQVATKLHQNEDDLAFFSEKMFLTRKPENARDPVVICGTVSSAVPQPAETSVRFISNGAPNGTFLDDKKQPFQDRWAGSCKSIDQPGLFRT